MAAPPAAKRIDSQDLAGIEAQLVFGRELVDAAWRARPDRRGLRPASNPGLRASGAEALPRATRASAPCKASDGSETMTRVIDWRPRSLLDP